MGSLRSRPGVLWRRAALLWGKAGQSAPDLVQEPSRAPSLTSQQVQVGDVYGSWEVLELTRLPPAPGFPDGRPVARCRCPCGESPDQDIRPYSLVHGHSTRCRSCAGSRRWPGSEEAAPEESSAPEPSSDPIYKGRLANRPAAKVKVGDVFGMWEVLELTRCEPRPSRTLGAVAARCRCLCGASPELLIERTRLVSGATTRCYRCAARAGWASRRGVPS